jgi:hypothetical protein
MLMVSDENKRQHNGVVSQLSRHRWQANTLPYGENGRICFGVADRDLKKNCDAVPKGGTAAVKHIHAGSVVTAD